MSSNANNPVSVLGNTLLEIPKQLKDRFLLGILAYVIVLGIVAVVRTNIYVTIVIASVVVLLFFAYLYYLWRVFVTRAEQTTMRLAKQTEQMSRNLAKNMSSAIKKGEYIKGGHRTQMDFGASLMGAIQRTQKEMKEMNEADDQIKVLEVMTKEFKIEFDVPDYL